MMARRISLTGAFLRSTPIEIKRRIASELRHNVWPHLGKAIQPVIDRTYPLSEAAAAHAQMERSGISAKSSCPFRPEVKYASAARTLCVRTFKQPRTLPEVLADSAICPAQAAAAGRSQNRCISFGEPVSVFSETVGAGGDL